jgi:hypothetical protein
MLPTAGQQLDHLVNAPAPVTIADVIARMQAIDALLPANDGLKWFNRLYLMVTQEVDLHPPVARGRAQSGSPASMSSSPAFTSALWPVFSVETPCPRHGTRCLRHAIAMASIVSSLRLLA